MPRARIGDVDIEYEVTGPADGEPMLLIMGLGAQLTSWSDTLKDGLIERGFRLICFDSRDCGLSTHLDAAGFPDFDAIERALANGTPPPVAYGLNDMARDAVGLLKALDIEKAHVLGTSMGGMISQLLAAEFPDHVLSLTAMMCPSHVGKPDAASLKVMAAPPAPGVTLEMIAQTAATFMLPMASPGFPTTVERLAAAMLKTYRRSYYPEGFVRQTAAAYADSSRVARLGDIKAPTLILHGEADMLAPVEGARQMAEAIPNSQLETIPAWGHDMPADLMPTLVEHIARNARRAVTV